MNKSFLLSTFLCISLVSISSHAGLISFTDRSSFESALSTFVVEDFELIPSPGSSRNLGTSVSFGDVTLSNSGTVWATSAFGAPSIQVGDQNNRDTVISLAAGYNAIGMDMGLLFGAGTIDVILKDILNNTLLSQSLSVTDNNNLGTANTTFFGFISDTTDLQSLTLVKGGFPTIDNLTIGSTSKNNIPEPAMISLFAMGLLLMRRFRTSSRN